MNFENLKLEKINYVVEYTPKLKRWDAKNRHDHIIGIQFKGCAMHDFGYKKFNIEEDCIYFLNQKDNFSVQVIEQTTALSVHFTTFFPIDTDSFCFKLRSIREIKMLINKLQKTHVDNLDSNEANCLFYSICAFIDKARKKTYVTIKQGIIDAKRHLDQAFDKKDCLEMATKISGVSRRRFNDLFKNTFGSSPNRYVTLKKIETACKLLNSGVFPIGEIADMCGFSDIYYFSKVFKQETGCSPSSYKRHS